MNGWVKELYADLSPNVLKVDTQKVLKISYNEEKTIHSNLDGADVMVPQLQGWVWTEMEKGIMASRTEAGSGN